MNWKEWSQKLLLMLISVGGGIAIAEIALAIVGFSHVSLITYDERRGFAPRPGAKGWYTYEGKSYVEINKDGLRDRDYSLAKPEDTVRIAVLGDSFTEAWQVPVTETFWSVMESELANCPTFANQEVEVINFGVSNYGTAQQLLTLRHKAWQYQPDIVVLAMFTGNDIINNSKKLEKDPMRPFFVYQEGELVLDNSFRELPSYQKEKSLLWRSFKTASNYSRVVQLLGKSASSIRFSQPTQAQDQKTEPEVKPQPRMVSINPQSYQPPNEPVWQEAWQITESLLGIMNNEVQQKEVEFLVTTISNPQEVHPDPNFRQQFKEYWEIDSLIYPNQRIENAGKDKGFSVLNLSPSLRSYAEENQVCLHGFDKKMICDGHWNSEGHRLAGQKIAQRLCQNIDLSKLKDNSKVD